MKRILLLGDSIRMGYDKYVRLAFKDIAEVVYFAASAPEHMQIAEVLVMPTNQATGTIVAKTSITMK